MRACLSHVKTQAASRVIRLALSFSELFGGAPDNNGFVLDGGDAGLLRSLDRLSASDVSRSVHDGATIAAQIRHVRYGLSLMGREIRQERRSA